MAVEKAVWLLAGGPMQRRAAETIKARGYKLILTDASLECVCKDLADVFVHLDTFDSEGNLARIPDLAAQYEIKAVFTAGADCHETVAHLARALALPGIDPALAHLCRHKYLTRERLTAAGIPQPRFTTVRTFAEAQAALRGIGLPAALKATDSSGSRGFSPILEAEDLTEEAFARALGYGSAGLVIVEELLIPRAGKISEQSVETVWYDGTMHWLNWVDRLFRKDFATIPHPWSAQEDPYKDISWAVELAHFNPSQEEEALRQEVEALIRRAGVAIGMDTQKGGHILKADIMLTTKGPMILELTLRLSGGWDSSYSTLERGADFVGGALSLALGEPLDDALFKRYFTYTHAERVVAVLAKVKQEADDCIGREFAPGTGGSLEEALQRAYESLRAGRFLH